MANEWYSEEVAEGSITSDDAPLTPSKLLYNNDLFWVYSSHQIMMPPQASPQVCEVHSQVEENHLRWVKRQLVQTQSLTLLLSLKHCTAQGTESQKFHSQSTAALNHSFFPNIFEVALKCDIGLTFSPKAACFRFSFPANRSRPLTIRQLRGCCALIHLSRDGVECNL